MKITDGFKFGKPEGGPLGLQEKKTEKPDLKKVAEEARICSDILLYGKDIMMSPIFQQTIKQKHHHFGTVFIHTINVCVASVRLCYQLKDRGISVNEKDLIQAALCHDLGLVSRDEKYKDRLDAWQSHPKESARIAREIVPDLSKEAEDMILSHMWPVAGPPPSSNEGMLLCMADKYASMAEWKNWMTDYGFPSIISEQINKVQKA